MKITCPICGTDYEVGAVKFCTRCMYSMYTDAFLNHMLTQPSIDDLKFYNDRIKEYRTLWQARNPVKNLVVSGLLEMVDVEGGSFTMGSDDGESDERPLHVVSVVSFLMSRMTITVGAFNKFMEDTNYITDADKDGGSIVWAENGWEKTSGVNWRFDSFGNVRSDLEMNHPVTHVSWNDAIAFCDWLSEKEGLNKTYSGSGKSLCCDFKSNGYRLPTEAEWEYAAKGGRRSKGFKYSGGNDIEEVAWYKGNSNSNIHPVGTKESNELGIYDMNGNVWEWCWDWYGEYTPLNQIDPNGPHSGSFHVIRGGGWFCNAENCRVARRDNNVSTYRNIDLGFRVVRTKN